MFRAGKTENPIVLVMFFIGLIIGLITSKIGPLVYYNITDTDSLEVAIYKDFQAQGYENIPKYFEDDYKDWIFREKKEKFMKSRNKDK